MWGQSDAVLALHFGISLISFASVLLLTLIIFEVDQKLDATNMRLGSKMKKHIYGVILYTYAVVYTGALVRHKEASLACPDVPFCSNRNGWLPVDLNQWIQMGHRFAAVLTFVWILAAFIHAVKYYRHQKNIFYGWLVKPHSSYFPGGFRYACCYHTSAARARPCSFFNYLFPIRCIKLLNLTCNASYI